MAITADPLRERRAEVILQQLEDLPPLPTSAIAALKLGAGQAETLVQLIQQDPAIAERVLKLLRFDGDVAQATAALWLDAVRDAFLCVVIFQAFYGVKPGGGAFSRLEYWKHSIAVACAAELLAEQLVT